MVNNVSEDSRLFLYEIARKRHQSITFLRFDESMVDASIIIVFTAMKIPNVDTLGSLQVRREEEEKDYNKLVIVLQNAVKSKQRHTSVESAASFILRVSLIRRHTTQSERRKETSPNNLMELRTNLHWTEMHSSHLI